MAEAHIVNLADHSFLLALPAFGPAVAVAAVVVYAAIRDRHKRDTESPSANTETP